MTFALDTALFDLETDGLLDTVTKIHMLVIKDLETSETRVYRPNWQAPFRRKAYPLEEGLEVLHRARLVVGHNITAYDCPVLEKLHGLVIPWSRQRDTMVLARLVWPDVKRTDLDNHKKKKKPTKVPFAVPGQMIGRHSLEAWGHRLGMHKASYEGDTRIADLEERKRTKWLAWNPDMEDYGVQDVEVAATIYRRILSKNYAERAVLIETQVAHIIARQVRHGFLFSEERATALWKTLLVRKQELEEVLVSVFKPMYLFGGRMVPKRDNKKMGYVEGAPFSKVVLTPFNPNSRDHVAHWLKTLYGWEPEEFTPDGKAKIDEQVMLKLPYAEAAPLKEFFMVAKRIGQVAEGNEAWLKQVQADGRIHGSVNSNGAVTGRMTHSGPNVGQTPACYSPYGKECRECFIVPPGKKLVGADASALELCDLAGYMGAYDGGAYIKVVLEGGKKLGTDIHSVNARALGLDPNGIYFDGETGRDIAKTWFYAFIYGAGDEKLGYIRTRRKGDEAKAVGAKDRKAFLTNLPAMGKLVKAVKAVAKDRGYLIGLDGRHIPVRSQHAALNTLLQGAGAAQMKLALCLFDDSLQAAGLIPGTNYEFVANVHDEWQLEVDDEHAETVGRLAVAAIAAAGVAFNFRCPLSGEYGIGSSWADTH